MSPWAAALLFAAASFSCAVDAAPPRFPVEAAILAGDARLLIDSRTDAARRPILRQRIASSLGTLRLLGREFLQECGRGSSSVAGSAGRTRGERTGAASDTVAESCGARFTDQRERQARLLQRIDRLRRQFRDGSLPAFAAGAASLAERYPLELSGLRARDADARARSDGKRIYDHVCRSCHQGPDAPRSEMNLFRMSKDLPEPEFIARLIGGVHGTPAVALRNPFSDGEIAGLAAYLQHSTSGRR